MTIVEKYAYDAWLEYIYETNLGEAVEAIYIYYKPQLEAMTRLLKRYNVNYKREGNYFYL